MSTPYQTWVIIGMLVCSALGLFVVAPFVATLSATTTLLGEAALCVAFICFIGWGHRLVHRPGGPSR